VYYSQSLFVGLSTAITVIVLLEFFKHCDLFKFYICLNFLHRITQLRERGIHFRIVRQCVPSKETSEEQSTIDVSMMTVAPILVVLAAGYIIGIVEMLIERYVHGNMFKYWPREGVRKHPENEY
jgi:hypothetical protein